MNAPGNFTFAIPGTEQDALAEYLNDLYSVSPYAVDETPASEDMRIQNLAERNDEVLVFCAQGFLPAPSNLTVILQPANSFIRLRWLPSPGSVACRVRGGVIGGDTLFRTVEINDYSAFAGFRVPKSILIPGAVYNFEVACACSTEPLIFSEFASSGAFIPVLAGMKPSAGASDAEVSMELFPNPASGQVQLAYALTSGHSATVEVTDLSGRRVMLHKLPEQESGLTTLRLDGLAPGFYTVALRDRDTRVVQKLVVR